MPIYAMLAVPTDRASRRLVHRGPFRGLPAEILRAATPVSLPSQGLLPTSCSAGEALVEWVNLAATAIFILWVSSEGGWWETPQPDQDFFAENLRKRLKK